MKARFSLAAEHDLSEAKACYDAISSSLGDEFIEAVKRRFFM